MRAVILVALLTIAAAPACSSSTSPTAPDVIGITGTVAYMTFEGGFWAIRGDDGTTYDPYNGLPAAFQQQGLRVRVDARILSATATIHMAGPVIEIISIRRL